MPELRVEVGGGIRATDDIKRLLDAGAFRVVIGSVAVKSPELAEYWIRQFGADRIVIGMDVKNGSIAISGWLEDGHRMPTDFLLDFVKRGARTFICTDISRDGMLGGTNLEFFQNLKSAFPQSTIIASGGISSLDDVLLLKNAGLAGVVIGKAIYEGRIPLAELAQLNGAPC